MSLERYVCPWVTMIDQIFISLLHGNALLYYGVIPD